MPQLTLHRFRFKAMGSPCELQLYAASKLDARAQAALARGEIERLERKYSRYRSDSLASRINASAGDTAGTPIDAETEALLDHADTCFQQSGGRFDPTSGILRQAWDFRSERLPEAGAIDALLPRIGWQKLARRPGRLVLPQIGMELDFGGFVKEYAADRCAARLRQAGCESGLVDLGGDLAILAPHPDGRPWSVGIRDAQHPTRATLRIPVFAGGVATSGDYERGMWVDGVRYGHILDPRSGWPVEGLASVSVLAERCLIAGSASTLALLQGSEAPAWLDALGLPHVRQHRDGRVEPRLSLRQPSEPGSPPAPSPPGAATRPGR